MASGGTEELERPTFKSPVWEHFGFPVKLNSEGKRLVDKTVTVCRHCGTRKPYNSGNTSSMATHLQRHHPGVSLTGVKPKAAQQPLITAAFKQPLPPQSDRAKAITNAIFLFFLLIRKMIRSVTLIRGTIRTVSFLIRCTPKDVVTTLQAKQS